MYFTLKLRSEDFFPGHSVGGVIALQFTLTHPEMAKSLIPSDRGGTMPRGAGGRRQEKIPQMAVTHQALIEAIKKEGMEAVVEDRFSRTFPPGFAERNPETVERYKLVLLQNKPEGY